MKKIPAYLWTPLLFIVIIFLIIKLTTIGIRFSDTNIYFLTAKELLSGKILYKDIFFTNFPLMPYVSIIYFLVSGGNLLFYYFTAVIEIIITTGIIYYILLNQSSSRLIASFACVSYIFSFLILATSDHQTGVFLASLFSVISYLCFLKKQYLLTGILVMLAILTKAYTLPLAISYFVLLLVINRKAFFNYIAGCFFTATIVLLPSIIFASSSFFRDVFIYSLTRTQGIDKWKIIFFTIQHDGFFVALLLINLIFFRKKSFFSYFSLFSILFLTFYRDTYYLYLSVTLSVITLSYSEIHALLSKKFSINRFVIPTIILFLTSYNFISYFNEYTDLQKVPDAALSAFLKKSSSKVIYGVNGLAPLLSYQTTIPLLNNIIDTNDNIFRKGYLNAYTLTKKAIDQHASVVVIGAYYPDANIKEDILTEIVDKKLLTTHCRLSKRFPFHSEGIINSIAIFSC